MGCVRVCVMGVGMVVCCVCTRDMERVRLHLPHAVLAGLSPQPQLSLSVIVTNGSVAS